MPKFFNLPEAIALLPAVEKSLREVLFLKNEIEQADAAVQAILQRILMTGGAQVDRQSVLAHRGNRDTSAARLKEAIESVHSQGCLVKDLDTGLVDFPALYRGEEVYLCWKLGEPTIEWWHGVEEGFRGRKKIDQDFVENHQGGYTN